MGFMDKVKNLVNPTDIDENNYAEDEYVFNGAENVDYTYSDDYTQQPQQQQQNQNQNTYRGGGASQQHQNNNENIAISSNSLEMKIIKPQKWESVNMIADHLINRRTVVLNLENTNKETARRMIDFILGVVYTIEGNIKKASAFTWIITPSNVDLSQEQQSQQRQSQSQIMEDPYDTI